MITHFILNRGTGWSIGSLVGEPMTGFLAMRAYITVNKSMGLRNDKELQVVIIYIREYVKEGSDTSWAH